jgi:hypothetical protein
MTEYVMYSSDELSSDEYPVLIYSVSGININNDNLL